MLAVGSVVVAVDGSAVTPIRSTGSQAVMASTALASSDISAIGLVVCTARLLGIIGLPEANADRR